MKLNCTIGNDSDPIKLAKAVSGLKLLAKLGLSAQKALDELKRNGYYEQKAPYLSEMLSGQVLQTNNFPKAVQITRDDFYGYGQISLQFSPVTESKVSGSQVRTFNVYMISPVLYHTYGEEVWFGYTGPKRKSTKLVKIKKQLKKTFLGEVRLKSNGSITCRLGNNWWHHPKANTIQLGKNTRPVGWDSKTSINLAKTITGEMISCTVSLRKEIPTRLMEIIKKMPGWLVKDGHIKELVSQIYAHAVSVRSVSDVMER